MPPPLDLPQKVRSGRRTTAPASAPVSQALARRSAEPEHLATAAAVTAVFSGAAQHAAEFFAELGSAQQFLRLFDFIEGVTLFVKDHSGRFVAFSNNHRSGLDFGESDEIVGLTDFDLYPKQVAERIRSDDERIMASGKPLLNIVELLVNPRRFVIDWYVTNKLPVLDAAGTVVGIMGTVQPFEGRRRKLLSGTRMDEVIERIREHPEVDHPIDQLAALAAMSPRNLTREFHSVLGMPPRDFIIYSRLKLACEHLVQTRQSVAEIATDCGFYDQSAFAYQFRQSFGLSPVEYRKRYFVSAQAACRK